MGCDIHTYTERFYPLGKRAKRPNAALEKLKESQQQYLLKYKTHLDGYVSRRRTEYPIDYSYREDGRWVWADPMVDNPYYDGESVFKFDKKKKVRDSPYQWRNYALFGLLAGVRNYTEFQPFALPKGFPLDASLGIWKEVNRWGIDGHDHSWLTLKEIKSFNWDVEAEREGFVSLREYLRVLEGKDPVYWLTEDEVVYHAKVITEDEMRLKLMALSEAERGLLKNSVPYSALRPHVSESDCNFYCHMRWRVTAREEIGKEFLTISVPKLEALSDGNPENDDNVRMVFWFDN